MSGACTGEVVAGQSCVPGGDGLSNCGPAAESCCTTIEVPGGTFYRTYNYVDGGATPGGEADPATISGFRIDKYLVTVRRFAQFVNAVSAGWTPSAGSGKHAHLNVGLGLADSANPGSYESGWQIADNAHLSVPAGLNTCGGSATWMLASDGGIRGTLPIDCVNEYEASAFCIWDGGFLLSEAEWEYAAAGGNQQREYPWGSVAPGVGCPGPGCQYAIYDCQYPNGSGNCAGVSNFAPVGTAVLGVGAWGQFDMVGEVGNWTLDWQASGGGDTYVNPCINCAYLQNATGSKVIRGGGYSMPAIVMQSWIRSTFDSPTSRMLPPPYGFRCARTP
jgi:formylglycine-generating enzyme required for sulfatase activity